METQKIVDQLVISAKESAQADAQRLGLTGEDAKKYVEENWRRYI